MTTEEPDLAGIVLDDRYRLHARLGMGGMGSVYEAQHVRIAKPVAVKVLNREFSYKESFRRRFLREAQAASLIGHRNVVEIHDFGDDEGVVYMVMELLAGRDLHHVIHERAPLGWAEARGLLLQMAGALGAAHASGVIHRDVKPANVFIVDDDEGPLVKVLDFGIARASRMNLTEPAQSNATASSRVFGTPTYMAPELAFGDVADARSDIYSLGVVAYRMLTSLLPFEGDVPFLVISRHANEPPLPLRSIEPSVPRGVELVVLKALAKQPRDRFQSMTSFGLALAAIGEDGQGEVPAELLTETEDAPVQLSEPRGRRSRRGVANDATAAAGGARASAGRVDNGAPAPARPEQTHRIEEAPNSESSDVGTQVTDLGTERLPSRRRRDDWSESSGITDVGRTGFTERVTTGPSQQVDDVAVPIAIESSGSASMVEQVDATVIGVDEPPPRSRKGGWLMQAAGLAALVAVAAAVGALVARSGGGTTSIAEGVAPLEARSPGSAERGDNGVAPAASATASDTADSAGPGPGDDTGAASSNGRSSGSDGGSSDGGSSAGTTSGGTSSTDTDAQAGTVSTVPPPPPVATPTPVRRKRTDAQMKKKLKRDIKRRCVDGASGYRTRIEGFISEKGRVSDVRVIDAPAGARECIKRLAAAQRFPPGELRTLDLSIPL